MTHEWILDVLDDLGDYAQTHDLRALAVQLDVIKRVATAECRGAVVVTPAGRDAGEPKSADDAGEARSAM